MNIVGRKKLDDFKKKYTDACSQIDSWEAEASLAHWTKYLEIKNRYSSADFLKNNQVVFNIKGNKYRLLVQVDYKNQIVLIKKVGTHNEYMKWLIN